MPITLTEMRNSVVDDNLNTNLSQFGFTKVDRAIRWAGTEYLRHTHATRTSGTCTISSAASTVNIAGTITDFLPGRLLSPPFITSNFRYLGVVSFDKIRHERDRSDVSGVPEMIHFINGTVAELYPKADAEYTLKLIYWQPLTTWTIGVATSDSVTLNIPAAHVDIVALGAAAKLLQGQPGQQDWAAKMAEFKSALETAKAETTLTGLYFDERDADWSHSYFRTDPI